MYSLRQLRRDSRRERRPAGRFSDELEEAEADAVDVCIESVGSTRQTRCAFERSERIVRRLEL